MNPGVIDSIVLLLAVFFAVLYGMPFRLARGTLWENWRDRYTTFCDLAYSVATFLYIGAAILLAFAFKWWVAILVLFVGARLAVAVTRRVERIVLLQLGKFSLLISYILLVAVIIHLGLRLWS